MNTGWLVVEVGTRSIKANPFECTKLDLITLAKQQKSVVLR